jgi:hypothetical protein
MTDAHNTAKPDILEKIRPDEPCFTFRAQDRHAPDVLAYYASLCEQDEQADGVIAALNDFRIWQADNADLVKEPTA